MKTILLSLLLFILMSCTMNDGLLTAEETKSNQTTASKAGTLSTLTFSGYKWNVKSGVGMGPGPNSWSANNVWVDTAGKLHLKISYNQITGKWECAEVWTANKLGFGTYEWVIEGKVDQFDKNVVLGLFNYMPTAGGASEIDIEFAKWGIPTLSKMGSFTVWPTRSGLKPWTSTFAITSTQTNAPTKHTFNWQSKSVTFKSTDVNGRIIASAVYRPTKYTQYIPQVSEPININLWLFQGITVMPTDKTTEIIIHSFRKI